MNEAEGIGEIFADVLWWVGWKPFIIGGIGAAAGVLVGFFRGSIGLVAAAALFFIALGLVEPELLKTGFVASVISFVVFFVVGPGRIENALAGFGVTSIAETVSVFMLEIAAFAGADVSTRQPTEVVGSAVAGVAFWSLAGAAVGTAVWLVGVYEVNRRHAGVFEELVDTVRDEGKRILGEDGNLHTLTHGEGSVALVGPDERYYVANALVGESSVCLHYGSKVEMPSQETVMSDNTKELYYDKISSVDYRRNRLKIKSVGGGFATVLTTEKPTELIEEVDEKVQEYKTKKTAETEVQDATVDGSEVESETKEGSETGSERKPEPKTEHEPEPTVSTEPDKGSGSEDFGAGIAEEVEDALDAFDSAIGEGNQEDSGEGDDIFGSTDDETGEGSPIEEVADIFGGTEEDEAAERDEDGDADEKG